MKTHTLDIGLLVPVADVLLLGTFGISLVKSMRGLTDLQTCIERLIVGFLGIVFFKQAATTLQTVSDSLTSQLMQLGDTGRLKAIVLEAFRSAAMDTPNTRFDTPSFVEQAWRTGVWGVMTMIVDGTFLIVSFILECAREVLWNLLQVLFPIAAGLYPILPRILINLTIYSVELALWFPILCLVEMITGSVAQKYMTMNGSWGLYVIAIEVIAILLILLIPTLTHQFLGGAFSGDFETGAGIVRTAKSFGGIMKGKLGAK